MPSADIELEDLARLGAPLENVQAHTNTERPVIPSRSQDDGVISSWAWATAAL